MTDNTCQVASSASAAVEDAVVARIASLVPNVPRSAIRKELGVYVHAILI